MNLWIHCGEERVGQMERVVWSLVAKLCLTLLWPCEMLPTRLPCPLYLPTKNTGAGCHFPLQGSARPRDGTRVSCIGRQLLYHGASTEVLTSLTLKSKTFCCIYCFLLALQTLSTVWRCLFCQIMDYLAKQKNLVFFPDYFQCYVSGILCRCYSLFIFIAQ